jgi:hypothetical protein
MMKFIGQSAHEMSLFSEEMDEVKVSYCPVREWRWGEQLPTAHN